MDDDRRRVLRVLAGSAVGSAALAGCLGWGSDGDGSADRDDPPRTGAVTTTNPPGRATDATAREAPTPTAVGTPTVTGRDARAVGDTASGPVTTDAEGDAGASARVVLERVDGRPTGTVAVYQPTLRASLREAATTDSVVRTVAETTVDNPQPVLPSFDAVELVDESGAASGVYDLTAEGGTHYRMTVGAREVTGVEEVTSLSTLSPARRELLRSAIRGEYVGVTPETERGAWVRHEVFGHAFEADGTVYRFRERSATDAAFFSSDVWYTLELEPTDAPESEPVRLRLAELDDTVRATLDPLVESGTHRRAPDRVASEPGPVPEAVTAFADRTAGILIHVGALALTVE